MHNKLIFAILVTILLLPIVLYQSTATNSIDVDAKKKSKSNLASNAAGGKGVMLCYVGKVTKIVDGDTLEIDRAKVRLSLTNTPEKKQKGFNEAKSFTAKLCKIDTNAMVDQDDKQPIDKYGRIVGKVYCANNKVLNSELLYNGLAYIYRQYCKTSEFATEDWAQQNGCM